MENKNTDFFQILPDHLNNIATTFRPVFLNQI